MKTHKEYLDKQLSDKKFADRFYREKEEIKMNKEYAEKVNAMTNDELRIRAAKLAGWKKLAGYIDEWISGPDDSDSLTPPYYADFIEDAWKLIDLLADIGDNSIMVRFDSLRTNDHNNPNWTIHITPDIRMDVNREDVPRAITKAFIMAMESKDANV